MAPLDDQPQTSLEQDRDALLNDIAQEWLTRRLGSVEPADLELNVRICSLAPIDPPSAWNDIWMNYDGQGTPLAERYAADIAELDAIVLLSSPLDEGQVSLLFQTVHALDDCGEDGPFIIWVPHTILPEVGMNTCQDIAKLCPPLLQEGLDGLMDDEPEGLAFILALQLRINSLELRADKVARQLRRRGAIEERTRILETNMDRLLWDYVRCRAAPSIPEADPQIPPGEIRHLDGFEVGPVLGRGAFGTVRLLRKPGATEEDEYQRVVKMMEKKSLNDVGSVFKIRREMDIMSRLEGTWAHPNVVGLRGVFCSTTHVFFLMDYAGPMNLYRCLACRDMPGERYKALSLTKTLSVMEQAIIAVGHIHMVPQICHRDIKPENFIVDDIDDGPIVVKLADFDMACFHREGVLCRSVCGTMPFMAPEVMAEGLYDGRGADIWGLAVVMLEVLCCNRILEKAIGVCSSESTKLPSKEVAEEVSAAFSDPDMVMSILQYHIRPELAVLEPAVVPILRGMLTVDPEQRWDTHQVVSSAQTLALYVSENS